MRPPNLTLQRGVCARPEQGVDVRAPGGKDERAGPGPGTIVGAPVNPVDVDDVGAQPSEKVAVLLDKYMARIEEQLAAAAVAPTAPATPTT